MYTRSFWRLFAPLAVLWFLPSPACADDPAAEALKPSIVYKVQGSDERLEMVIRTSRILTMDQKIARTTVGNPDLLDFAALSPNQVQISAKATGVTQINIWDENKKLHAIDVLIIGDARELGMVLRTNFPNATLKVTPVATSVMISGFVDKNEHIDRIIQIAEQYYPKVINNMTVGGCQQVMLHVKIMEVSRTKLRRLGFDWAKITGSNMVMSGASGMILPPSSPSLASGVSANTPPAAATTSNNPIAGTFAFNIANGSSAFFGVLDAMREDDLAKILAEPVLTTISGRPASFRAGGSFYIVPNGQNGGPPLTVKYGTQLDFVPIVLGNGRIRLEVRSTISEPDPSQPSQYQPALKDRNADTGSELQAGQTMAIAGLVESRIEAANAGLPWISDVPYLGLAFRRVKEVRNEVELLILVTPELVEGLDASEVPPCGPGMQTGSPSDWELYMKGQLEVPKCPPKPLSGSQGPCGKVDGGGSNGGDSSEPPDGMIGPTEQIPTPPPAGAPQNRHSPSKPNYQSPTNPSTSNDGPPGFIGPVGYDVVK
jgi:pilus assembly protein CpaC